MTPHVSSSAHDWRRWVAFDHCRVLLPQFSFANRHDALGRLQRLSLDEETPEPAQPGPLGRACARVWFAVVALHQMTIFFLRYSGYVESEDGVSRRQQLSDLWHCIWRHNRYARHYYWRKLYLMPLRPHWLENLEHRQLTTLLRHLNRHLPIELVTDKFNFHHHCRRHRLPTPDVLGAWDASGRTLRAETRGIAGDLFLKPSAEFGSAGIQILRWNGIRGTHRLDGCEYEWDELLEALARRCSSQHRSFVLQPRLHNASRNAIYGDYDVCNVRIVTALPPDGAPEAIGAFIRLPSHFTTSGYGRRVLFSTIDLETGRMATARLREITEGEFRFHPETRAPISGRMLPGWDEMLELALRAHATMTWLPFVGWDIVDTASHGVALLEANAFWGGDVLQPPGGPTLGETRFPEIYLAWFDRLHGQPVSAAP